MVSLTCGTNTEVVWAIKREVLKAPSIVRMVQTPHRNFLISRLLQYYYFARAFTIHVALLFARVVNLTKLERIRCLLAGAVRSFIHAGRSTRKYWHAFAIPARTVLHSSS